MHTQIVGPTSGAGTTSPRNGSVTSHRDPDSPVDTEEPSEDVEFVIDHSDRFEAEIEDGDPTVATLFRIRVDGTYLISPDPSIGVFEFVIQQMNRILSVVPEIIEGTEVTVPWLGQSSDLEFIPWEENVVGVWTGLHDESDNPAVPRGASR